MVLDPVSLDSKQVFAIDQFLMQGGTVVLAAAPTDVQVQQSIVARPVSSGLEGWLADYGLSYGKGLVLDQQSGALPIPVQREVGGYAVEEVELAKYPYIVDVRGRGLNATTPITSSLGQIDVPWVAPLAVDATKNGSRKVTALLQSSDRSWISDSTDLMPDYRAYPDSGFAVGKPSGAKLLGVMVEGEFDSAFKGKPSPLLPAADAAMKPADSGKPADPAKPAASAAAQPKSAAVKSNGSKSGAAGAKATPSAGSPTPATAEKPVIDRVIQHSPSASRLIVLGSSSMLSDQVIRLIGESLGTTYTQPTAFMQNVVEWSLEDQGLLSIRGREHFARTLVPMSRSAQNLWEYLNYGAALGGLALIWVLNRRRRRAAGVRHLKLLEQV
jgi:ABC-2 type transport system permease protein